MVAAVAVSPTAHRESCALCPLRMCAVKISMQQIKYSDVKQTAAAIRLGQPYMFA